jgi:hypothetical protein
MASAFQENDAQAESLGDHGEERASEAGSNDSDIKALAQKASEN